MNHLRIPFVMVATLVVLGACGSDGGAGPLFGTDASGSTVTLPGDVATTGPTTPGPAAPLPIREGLGTFDNYQWRMQMNSVGPTASETSGTALEVSFNRDAESTITRTTTTQTGPDIEGVDESITERYVVAGEVCQWDGEEWTHTLATDQQQEVLDVVQRLFDIVIVPESPVVIGSETIAGIPATHYRFAVSGFGAESGALITANQMDYWLADGTGVVVKYQMVIESRSGPTTDPEAEVYRIEASAELLSANVFVPIELSPDCLAIPPEDA